MADDMGYGDLGCYGAVKIQTPNMDAVAEKGIRFTDAHSSSAVCTPSRYSVMTGRYCWRTHMKFGVLGGFGAPLIEPERPTVASLLKKNGYRTAAVGKWHLGFHWTTKDGRRLSDARSWKAWHLDGFDVDYTKPIHGGPRDLGFDSFFGISGSLDMPPYCFIEDNHTFGIPLKEKSPYKEQQRRGLMVPDWQDDRVDVTFAEKAAEFITGHVRDYPDKPFFLYLTPSAPHRPCVPPPFIRGKSRAGLRGDSVVLVDWMVGQVMETLQRCNIADNTLLMITSDNGGRLTNYDGKDYGHKTNGDLRGQKADIWEGGHREPFVAMWPDKIPEGTESSELVCLIDIMATCADIVGDHPPAQSAEDSMSILPVLLGQPQKDAVRESLIHHSYDGMFSLRKGDWKYIEGVGSGGFSEPRRYEPGPNEPEGQLFHIRDNRFETLNLWKDRRDIVEELSTRLDHCRNEGRSRDL